VKPVVKEVEPVSMMELVKQMQNKVTENQHPNTQNLRSPNDSFSSDDILETLDSRDQECTMSSDGLRSTKYSNFTEEELKNEIESLLLPNLNMDSRYQNPSLQPKPLVTESKYIKVIPLTNEEKSMNTFVVNDELNFNQQDDVAEEVISLNAPAAPIEPVVTESEVEQTESVENAEYTPIQKFEFDG